MCPGRYRAERPTEGTKFVRIQPGRRFAGYCSDDWMDESEVFGVKMPMNVAETLRLHRKGLRACYNYKISTDPLEGRNTEIKTTQGQD